MAGDWIKMRGSLVSHPKLIRMSRLLLANQEFREWLTPGGGGPVNGQIVSDSALRTVALALLCVTWSAAREHGKFVGNDLLLHGLELDDIDQMAGAPGVGRAMATVGWAVESADKIAVTLPNFKEYNVPHSAAERMAQSRRLRSLSGGLNVTDCCATVAPRAQQKRNQRRVEKSILFNPLNPPSELIADCLRTDAFRQAWTQWVEYRQSSKKITPKAAALQLKHLAEWGHDAAILAIETAIRNDWTGLFEPKGKPTARNGSESPSAIAIAQAMKDPTK